MSHFLLQSSLTFTHLSLSIKSEDNKRSESRRTGNPRTGTLGSTWLRDFRAFCLSCCFNRTPFRKLHSVTEKSKSFILQTTKWMLNSKGSPTSLSLSFFICELVLQKHPPHFPHGCIAKSKHDKGRKSTSYLFKTLRSRDFLVVQWTGICCQCRGHGFDPWPGKIPPACGPQLLSPGAAVAEAHRPRPRAPQQAKPPQWEARTPPNRGGPTLRNYRQPTRATKAQHSCK